MFALGSYVAGFFLSVPAFYLLYGWSFAHNTVLPGWGVVDSIGEALREHLYEDST